MNKKVLFTNGPDWATFDTIVMGITTGATARWTYDSPEIMKAQWIGEPEEWDRSKIYRITIEEVDKDGNTEDDSIAAKGYRVIPEDKSNG